MTRNFGLTGNRSALGADVRSGPIIASGGTREPIWLAGLEADLLCTSSATKLSSRSRPLGARNEDASIQLAGKTSRPANSRGASSELSIREGAAAVFVGVFFGAISLVLLILAHLIDWQGVGETLSRILDLG